MSRRRWIVLGTTLVGRHLREALKQAFDAEGIHLALPRIATAATSS